MTNLTPTVLWQAVRQVERTDPVLGGPGGIANDQAQALLNRTEFLNKYTPTPFINTHKYAVDELVLLDNGDTVQSTTPNNQNNPNVNMIGWVFYLTASKVKDSSGVSQQTINNMLHLATIQDLPSTAQKGQIAVVYDDLRGGKFFYDPDKSSVNNGGTVFNGWVRKYFGSVFVDWFCESDPSINDCSVATEKALAVTKGIQFSGREFLFTGRVGIPDYEQHNYALNMVKIQGNGDTVIKVDCKAHGRALITSSRGKANPTLESDIFVGKVIIQGITFLGVNTTRGHDLIEANKNLLDSVIDGDRIYNLYVKDNNFSHLYSGMVCKQSRGVNIEGGNAYSQSVTFVDNHFNNCTYLVEADQLINFRFLHNMCEKNYAGFKVHSKDTAIPAMSVVTLSDNLFEAGGMFLDVVGNLDAVAVWSNYFEYNIFEKVAIELTQILVIGKTNGCTFGNNNFGGQIDFTGYDTFYQDIKFTGDTYDDSAKTDVLRSKPVFIGNRTTSRKLASSSYGVFIGNSSPFTLKNGWAQVKDGASHFNTMALASHQDNDVSFSRGLFDKPVSYSATAVNGTNVATLRSSDAGLMVGILDLSHIEGEAAKNKISTLTGEIDCNIELVGAGVTIGNVSAKIHIGIVQTGFGDSPSNQFNQLRVYAKLISILEPYDIPVVISRPSDLMKRQFDDLTAAVIEPVGGGRYAVRLTGYKNLAIGSLGKPTDIINSITWQASVGCRERQDQLGANVTFIGYWW